MRAGVEVAEINENVEEPVVTSVQQGSKQIQTSHFWNGRCPPPFKGKPRENEVESHDHVSRQLHK
jgi:hypothetical protein